MPAIDHNQIRHQVQTSTYSSYTCHIMSTYKALQVFEPSNGYRTASKVVELPIPSATPGNVVVRNTYASVAAYDTLVFTNKFMFMGEQKLPFTAGLEASAFT